MTEGGEGWVEDLWIAILTHSVSEEEGKSVLCFR